MEKRARFGIFAAAVAGVAGVFILSYFRSVPREAVYPVERAKVSLLRRVARRASALWDAQRAVSENASLRSAAAALAMDRAEYARVEAENARLRRALGFAEAHPGRWVAAEVLSCGGAAAGSACTLRASKGSLHGVKPDACVETPDGLAGRVVSVTPHTCEVALLTDPSCKVSCTVLAERPVRAVACGCGADAPLAARHVRGGAEIPPMSKVVTSGAGGVFPPGIPVGSFYFADGEDGSHGPEREGLVVPAVDFGTLEDVFIRL